ncbi:hypothetical protein [Streptomyces virginiae]|uniref:hypothetical protein n=1 Tax=Streptomyces virginiae TaxID=1961 RepID=UPI0022538977|nr:hypothetical protein [Streptomyces virginiae]MCX4959612.1 hypothetical protein [Streptomyces virginiae]
MTTRLTHAETVRRIDERLDAPRSGGENWSTDFFPRDREALTNYLAKTGRYGEYGPNFEELADPRAVHVPGCLERSVSALMDAMTDTGLTVAAELRPGKNPRYGLGGRHATAGLMDLRGVVLALVVEYAENVRQVPTELLFAAERVSTSGTHAGGVAFKFAKTLTRERV